MRVDYEARFYLALKRLTAYSTGARLRRDAEKLYGLEASEAMEMTIDNMRDEAIRALKGYRPRKAATIPNE